MCLLALGFVVMTSPRCSNVRGPLLKISIAAIPCESQRRQPALLRLTQRPRACLQATRVNCTHACKQGESTYNLYDNRLIDTERGAAHAKHDRRNPYSLGDAVDCRSRCSGRSKCTDRVPGKEGYSHGIAQTDLRCGRGPAQTVRRASQCTQAMGGASCRAETVRSVFHGAQV